jgi:hypothetical protein
MMPLLVGIVLAISALAFILYPIFRVPAVDTVPAPGTRTTTRSDSQTQSAIEALREIEFDRATGKLSDDDYASLRARFTSAAVTEMRNADAAAATSHDGAFDAAEALVSQFRSGARSCVECGPRPEPDAAYCSNCGRFLAGSCNQCGAHIAEPGAQFCSSCGARLAA